MAKGRNVASTSPRQKYLERPVTGVLNEETNAARLKPGELTIAHNVVYQPAGGAAKRTGTGPYGYPGTGPYTGYGVTGSGQPTQSGVRWYRGYPSSAAQMIVQSNDNLYLGNDATGGFTHIGALLDPGSSPAFWCSAYDPAESGVGGTPASDVLIFTYASGPPMKWDGTNLTQLSSAITNNFKGCTYWHDHVWFWGDPNNPDTLYATDINNPESYTFSTNFGGYQIGQGDGDPYIQCVIGVGNFLYVFKANSIYLLQGFDFATGNFQFTIQPLSENIGTDAPYSVARVKDAVIFWSGTVFKSLQPDGTIIPLGVPIQTEEALAAQPPAMDSLARAVGGTFQVAAANAGTTLYEDVYLCAMDQGNGIAQNVMMYDDVASQQFGKPAWSVLTAANGMLNVGCFIPWLNARHANNYDEKYLYFGSSTADLISQFGQNATNDAGNGIPVTVQLSRDDCGSPDQTKWLQSVYGRIDTGQATFTMTVYSDNPNATQTVTATASSSQASGSLFGTGKFGSAIFGPALGTNYQSLYFKIDPWLRGRNFQIQISESSATSAWEILGVAMHLIEEALPFD